MTAPRKEDDWQERTTSIGLFNFAESYWQAANALNKVQLKSTHPDSPVAFLYYHAIELYLKAFLRMHGHRPFELASWKFGHSTHRLKNRAEKLGLTFNNEDLEVLSLMATTDAVNRSRYIQTGYFRWPAPGVLDRTCKSLRKSVGSKLREKGITVRL